MSHAQLRGFALIFAVLIALPRPTLADVQRVTVKTPDNPVWVGQKATFFVILKGEGPFVGASSFSLPRVPRTVILKVGNPVVSSEELDGESWLVQTHEFALFSQADGVVEVPAFEVRFSNRDGFTGPEQKHVEQVPKFQLRVERPTGSDPGSFLVTTDTLTVTEQWDPPVGAAKQGDVFRRTITQRAEQVSGMALAPPPTTVPDGVRIHIDDPVIQDRTERGDFTGIRTDTITYVLRSSGKLALPAVRYVWWKPESESLGSTTLPAVTFDVAAITSNVAQLSTTENRVRWGRWLAAIVALFTLVAFQHRRLVCILQNLWRKMNPPEAQAGRRLLRACRQNDPHAAESAWLHLQTLTPQDQPFDAAVQQAVSALHRRLYGPADANVSPWSGAPLAAAWKHARSSRRRRHAGYSSLPALNPRD